MRVLWREGDSKMIALQLLLPIMLLWTAAAPSARAQTGKDLLGACTSADPIQQASCMSYISGFVHGLRAADRFRNELCTPKDLTANEARSIFVETMAHVELAAALDRRTGGIPMFTYPQNAALAAALEMKFKCPPKEAHKIRKGR